MDVKRMSKQSCILYTDELVEKRKKWCVTSERMKLLMRVNELVADAVKHKLKSLKISDCGIKRRNNVM